MRNATRLVTSTMGLIMGLAGIEHGIGEILQGSTAPNGMVFPSWPESEFFRILAGEPAMTIIPNLLITGILACLFSLIFILWVTLFVERKHSGPILMLLSVVMLLVGAGFGPPIMGVIIGATATRINTPLTWWRTHLPVGLMRFLGKLWPWSFRACLIAWLLLMPGSNILGYFFGVDNLSLVPILFFTALGLLLLTIFTGFSYDVQRQPDLPSGAFGQQVPEKRALESRSGGPAWR